MTTQNAMMERRSSDEMAALRKEVEELKSRLKYSQKALKEMIEEFLGKPVIPTQSFQAALKVYVSEEREACAKLVEKSIGFMCGSNTNEMIDSAKELADLIRKRT